MEELILELPTNHIKYQLPRNKIFQLGEICSPERRWVQTAVESFPGDRINHIFQ